MRLPLKKSLLFYILLLSIGCRPKATIVSSTAQSTQERDTVADVTIAFGSCNKHDKSNVFWDDILALRPDVFIWGGDNIYADTDNIAEMQAMYAQQNEVTGYAELRKTVAITGTWDDHDYGKNDAGAAFHAKKESQQAFLDFMGVADDSPRRIREGVYSTYTLRQPKGTVNIISLDTRYFRSKLQKSSGKGRRYEINDDPESTILGEVQWRWLDSELQNSTADFNVIVTSIQFLSDRHGFEMWGNFPHEIKRMKKLIANSGAKGVIFLSGDRHISEFSMTTLPGLDYPLVDFTSSGLTHAYSNFSGEPNPYRVGKVISEPSFGSLRIDFDKRKVLFQIRGDGGVVLQQLQQEY